jgi:hypothetical protein
LLLFVLSIQTINAMPPLQLLRMYSNAPNCKYKKMGKNL